MSCRDIPTNPLVQKAELRREGIEAFVAEYGEEHCVGLEDLMVTDWMSSEHSDSGEVDKAEWEAIRRMNKECGRHALEIRKREFRSHKVRSTIDRQTLNVLTLLA